MQSAPTPATQRKRRRGVRWWRILALGLLLALPQALLWMVLSVSPGAPLPQPLSVLVPLIPILYLLIPGVEGFLTTWLDGEGQSGMLGGCLVGVINFLALVVTTTTLLLVLTPSSACSSACPAPGGPASGMFAGWAFVLLGLQALGSLIGGFLGGLSGDQLGKVARGYRDEAIDPGANDTSVP